MSRVTPDWTRPDPANSKHADIVAFREAFWPTFVAGILCADGIVSGWNLTASTYNTDDSVASLTFANPVGERFMAEFTYLSSESGIYDVIQIYFDQNLGSGMELYNPGTCTFTYSGDLLQSYVWS